MYGELLAAGVHIHDSMPGMTHVKSMVVDGDWAVVGTTNIDNRSFEHNDEVNVAFREAAVAARLARDFDDDLRRSEEITLQSWKARPSGKSSPGR